jgi:hypothetical protein
LQISVLCKELDSSGRFCDNQRMAKNTSQFAPKNKVQELALKKHGITSQAEFQRAIAQAPYGVGRLTARNWWLNGVTAGMRLELAFTLADFLETGVDKLRADLDNGGKA